MYNYRPFYGETPEILLASRAGNNTTVIHGNNGAGKTAILNAFTWVLYEKFTPGLACPEQLVNKRAIAEAKREERVECWVKITFEHGGKKYLAKRICYALKTNNGVVQEKGDLSLQYANDDGRWIKPSQPPKDVINRVLPESLHRYFFFDGERIEKIVQTDKKAEMSAATKILLRVEVFDRAIRHLADAKKELEQDYQKIASAETAKLIQEKKNLEDELQILEERQNEIKEELKHQQELENNVEGQLRALESVQQLQEQRDALQQEVDSIQEKIKQGKNNLKSLTSRKSYVVLLSEAIVEFRIILDGLRKKGELPSGIKQQFVKDLLQQKRCICGTELIEGNQSYSLVETWMNRAGQEDVEETVIQMNAEVKSIDKQVPGFWKAIDEEQINQEQLRKRLATIENQLEDIHEDLKNSPIENIRDLENRRLQIKKSIRDLTLEEGEKRTNVEQLKNDIKRKDDLLMQQKANEKRQAVALKRIQVAQDAINRLSRIREIRDKRFRTELEQAVENIFKQMSFKPYVPKLSDNYELKLIENTSGSEENVAASSGENVMLSLSFISSIIGKVREWSKQQNLMDLGNSIFPVVMDNPFSSLDTEYKKQIARVVPQLADQLVLIINKAQWINEVEQEMTKYIGKQYVLTYYSPKHDSIEDNIDLYGHSYPLVKHSPIEQEYTEILEVNKYN
ncbi:MAG: AAA family ATPase [Nostoc sp.]|uniref:AAA family ATPase n=1 Tax=Nostoc sp. TaxID=1180 RepID=UPI002FFBBC8B